MAQKEANGSFYDDSIAFDTDSEILRLNPDNTHALAKVAFNNLIKKDYEKAIGYFSLLIDQDNQLLFPNVNDGTSALALRAICYYLEGNYADAVKDFEEAIILLPDDTVALKPYTEILSMSSDERFRNGALAVELSTRTCKLTDFSDAACLDTLACAYAEAGDFDSAVEYAAKAISAANDSQKEWYESHLKLFMEEKPFRWNKT